MDRSDHDIIRCDVCGWLDTIDLATRAPKCLTCQSPLPLRRSRDAVVWRLDRRIAYDDESREQVLRELVDGLEGLKVRADVITTLKLEFEETIYYSQASSIHQFPGGTMPVFVVVDRVFLRYNITGAVVEHKLAFGKRILKPAFLQVAFVLLQVLGSGNVSRRRVPGPSKPPQSPPRMKGPKDPPGTC